MKPWNKLSDRGKIRRLLEEKRALLVSLDCCHRHIDSLERQVAHAAGATQDMGAHCRALEVQAHAQRLQSQGISIFGGDRPAAKNLAVALEIPPLKSSTQKILPKP